MVIVIDRTRSKKAIEVARYENLKISKDMLKLKLFIFLLDFRAREGFRTYYNFIRPHMSLEGRTPAEASGLDLELEENRWLSLIKRSARLS